MTKPCITIIGLGLIGGSIGLALQASAKTIHVVGHDIDHHKNRLAQKKGAVDESKVNLLDACQDADLVIIATPITAIRETLQTIGPHLKQGCVVTDTATLKEPVLAWAAETLPPGVPFVGGDPLLDPTAQLDDKAEAQTRLAPQGLESARADLFQNAFYVLCPSADIAPTAVKRVADMVNLIQARPFFVDPIEHDGMRAGVAGLPALVSLALMQTVGGAQGWQETRKLADHVLGMATAPLDLWADNAEAQRAHILLNAAHLLPRLDTLIHELAQLREWITSKDAAALEAAFDQANSVRGRWLKERALGEWEEELGELTLSGAFSSLGSALGFGLGRRPPKED